MPKPHTAHHRLVAYIPEPGEAARGAEITIEVQIGSGGARSLALALRSIGAAAKLSTPKLTLDPAISADALYADLRQQLLEQGWELT
jgi:hypothetical protein